jgi:hypothetical protein
MIRRTTLRAVNRPHQRSDFSDARGATGPRRGAWMDHGSSSLDWWWLVHVLVLPQTGHLGAGGLGQARAGGALVDGTASNDDVWLDRIASMLIAVQY